MDPAFCMMRSHSMVSILFEKKIIFFRKRLGVATYLENNLKENKIRNKTLSATPSLEKIVRGKPKLCSGVRLPIGKVR